MTNYFVSPNGLPTNNGLTKETPWDIDHAFGNKPSPADKFSPERVPPEVKTGDVINLLGGKYIFGGECHLTGVTIQSLPGEWAVIDLYTPQDIPGGRRFNQYGPGTTIKNLEIFSSALKRKSDYPGSWPADMNFGGMTISADDVWLEKLIVHDIKGVGHFQSGGGVKGCIIYNCGWMGADNAHGHGLYVQNTDATKVKILYGNVSFCNFGYGIHCYATKATVGLRNLRVENNVCFNNGGAVGTVAGKWNHFPNIFVGGEQVGPENLVVKNNITFQNNSDGVTRFGYPWGKSIEGLQLAANIFADGRFALEKPINNFVAEDNIVVGKIENNSGQSLPSGIKIESNLPHFSKTISLDDEMSILVVSNPNKNVSGTIATGELTGKKMEVYEITDLNQPVFSGVLTGTSISFPINPVNVPRPLGWNVNVPVVIPVEFKVYIGYCEDAPVVPTDPVDPHDPHDPPEDPDDPEPPIISRKKIELYRHSDGRIEMVELDT